MNPKELFEGAVDQASHCIQRVQSEQLTYSTPCTEWDLKALLNHMVYELLWAADLASGKTLAEVGDHYEGDVLKGDVKTAWNQAKVKALSAVVEADPSTSVALSYATVPMSQYIAEVGGDILIHTWDVAQAIHCNIILNPSLVKEVYDNTLPRKDEFASSGLFAPSIEVSDDADNQNKLLALVGRRAPALN